MKIIKPKEKDIGGFSVRRALPDMRFPAIGPFVFFDHIGPASFAAEEGVDVRPHPHIGLATVTYLFSGDLVHRDSLGFVQTIEPGDVNWMVAGSGIVHSERSSDSFRANSSQLHGVQTWLALPKSDEETNPSFDHHPQASLPTISSKDRFIRVIVGQAFGKTSPAKVFSKTCYAYMELAQNAVLAIEEDVDELAIYVAEGSVDINGQTVSAFELAVLDVSAANQLRANSTSKAMLFGGEKLDGPRHKVWNFVSSDKSRIEQAKDDWKNGRFAQVPGETEFIPLPE